MNLTERTFTPNGEYIELHKLLKALGLAMHGGEAKNIVREGFVLVNGQTEERPGKKIISGDSVQINNTLITIQ